MSWIKLDTTRPYAQVFGDGGHKFEQFGLRFNDVGECMDERPANWVPPIESVQKYDAEGQKIDMVVHVPIIFGQPEPGEAEEDARIHGLDSGMAMLKKAVEEAIRPPVKPTKPTETVIGKQPEIKPDEDPADVADNVCPYCLREFSSAWGVRSHFRYCKKKPENV